MTNDKANRPNVRKVFVTRHVELQMMHLSFDTDSDHRWINLWVPNDIAKELADNILEELHEPEDC